MQNQWNIHHLKVCISYWKMGGFSHCQAQAAWLRDSAKLSEEIHEVPEMADGKRDEGRFFREPRKRGGTAKIEEKR